MSRPEETLEELARLAREDEARTDELPPELRAPLSAEKTAALVGAIHSRLAPAGRTEPPAPVASSAPHRRFVAAGGAAIVAMAAAVLLFIGSPGGPLPEYDARVEGGQQGERSGDARAGALRLRPGSKLGFELRPRTDYTAPVNARVTLSRGNEGAPLELELTQERSAQGALKVEARVPASVPARGEVVLSVERAGSVEGARQFRWPFERSP